MEQGVFAQWQPAYEALGIATFPVREKTPCVSNYLKMGQPASRKLLQRFGEAEGLGFACGKRSRITVLDIDAPDENLLADALAEFGQTPFVVRSASGNYQAWYRHNGERRQIRPFPGRAIDVLGGGYVVAPPSRTAKGAYGIIEGKLEDLGSLPNLRQPEIIHSPAAFQIGEQHSEQVAVSSLLDGPALGCGKRNVTLWRWCMKQAPRCRNGDELLAFALQANGARFRPSLVVEEVTAIVDRAWSKQECGENFFGARKGVVVSTETFDRLMLADADALTLFMILKRRNWGGSFICANAMAANMPGGGWTLRRFQAARSALEKSGAIVKVRQHSHKLPALYSFQTKR